MKRSILKECPSGESIVLYFSAEIGEDDRGALTEHVSQCPYCQLRLNALSSLRRELEAKKEDLPDTALSPRDEAEFRRFARAEARAGSRAERAAMPRLIRAAGILAAGLVLVIAGFQLFVHHSAPEPVMRGPERVEIRLHKPEGRIKEAPTIFSWSKIKECDGYRLHIVDGELNLIFSTSSAATHLHLPEAVRQKLVHQKPYLWTVSAFGDDDQEVASASGYFEIE
jgi:hypothetical protein